MKRCRIGILGLGTVGQSVVELIERYGDDIAEQCGARLEVVRASVKERRVERRLPAGASLSFDPLDVVRAENVDVVVEVVGGVPGPREWIATALRSGKPVVTANKAVLAAHGDELFALASENRVSLLFEAAVAGAIPIITAIREGLSAGPVHRMLAILNGSTNWLLGRLEAGLAFDAALAEAKHLGLVEQDPSLDLSGRDAAHKLALLARLLTGAGVDYRQFRCDGIELLDAVDFDYARRAGWVAKLLAVLERSEEGNAIGVFPAWLPKDHPLSNVRDENNAVLLSGPAFDELTFQGKGAGGYPTAGSVIADITRIARGLGEVTNNGNERPTIDPLESPHRFYLRFTVVDEPGVLAGIARALADHRISIAAVEQAEGRKHHATIHLMTHATSVSVLDASLAALTTGPLLLARPVRLPLIEERTDTRPR